MKPPAVILLGGMVATWNHRFLHAARRRGLAVLLVDGPTTGLAGLVEQRRSASSESRSSESPSSESPSSGHPLYGVTDCAEREPGEVGGVLEACLDWTDRWDVRGICSLREEFVEAAGLVTDLLGLSGPGLRASRVSRNKFLQRRYLSAWSPRSDLVVPAARVARVAAWDRFPAVVKPIGRLASSGVQLVLTPAELVEALEAYQPGEVLQFEERVVGPEFSVESLSRNGECLYVEVTEKRTTEGDSPYFVELGHTTPAVNLTESARANLLAAHAAVLNRLQFGTGIAHGEYRVTARGRVVLTEVAVRPPGDSILALHWLATGTPLEDALIGLAVGEDVVPPSHPRRYARQVYLPHQPGTLSGMAAPNGAGLEVTWFDRAAAHDPVREAGAATDPPTVRCLMALKPLGSQLGPLRESADRVSMFVIDATSPDALDQLEAQVSRDVHLEVSR